MGLEPLSPEGGKRSVEPPLQARPGLAFPVPVQGVVIDLDGTLLDTAADIATAATRMAADLGLPVPDAEVIKTYIGNGISRLVKRVLSGSMDGEPDADAARQALVVFEKHYAACVSAQSRPYPGVVDGLEAMRSGGLRLACVTNKAEKFTRPLLRDTGLAGYFEAVVSGDSLPRKKPDPMPLLHVAQTFGVAPGELLLIGDSVNDVEAARAAGMRVFCVPYGYNRGQDVRELDADAVVRDVAQAATLIVKGLR
ncbi:MAG: phosphoglycolate phosphatase [Betaproteobacteria bacterium]|nr:phosphoglycolate phosphatase [Betaproteobacteria bacterium]